MLCKQKNLKIAVRAPVLDARLIQGFDKAEADKEILGWISKKSNKICSVGRGDETTVFKMLPRFEFDQVCEIV